MPSNKSALQRYRIIDRLLINKYPNYPSKEKIRKTCAEELYGEDSGHISISTIEKDLRAMKDDGALGFFAPISYHREHKGYYYNDHNYSINKFELNKSELESLHLAIATLERFKGTQFFKNLSDSIDKISKRMALAEKMDGNTLNKYVKFDTPLVESSYDNLEFLLNAIRKKYAVSFTYNNFERTVPLNHIICPYLLKEYNGRWYLIGKSSKNKLLTFAFDRISNLKITNEKYQIPKEFDPDEHYKNSFGITVLDEKPQEVILSFTPWEGLYIKSKPLHHSQTILIDNKVELRIKIYVIITYELISAILFKGESVRVIRPSRLKKLIKESLQNSLKQYS